MDLKKQKKNNKFIIIFIILFFLFILNYIKPSNYKTNYLIDNYKVIEQYSKKEKKYYITIKVKDIVFNYQTNNNYKINKKLITNIKVNYKDDSTCIVPTSRKLTLYNLCYEDGLYKTYHEKKYLKKSIDKYENIYIYDKNNTYLLWNYKHFIFLKNNKKKTIKISDKDVYQLKNPYQTSTHLFIPNQDKKYMYTSAFIIDGKKGKVHTIKSNVNLYFDSYYLGDYDNNIYLLDRKNRQEYIIDLKNKEIKKTPGTILINNKWERINTNKLINKEYHFEDNNVLDYVIKDNVLYAKNNKKMIKILNNVDKIISKNNYEVYYLVKNTLYKYNFFKGYKKLLKYSEWEFNNQNMIFVFD